MLVVAYSSPYSRYSIVQESDSLYIVEESDNKITTLKTFDSSYYAFDIMSMIRYFVILLCKEPHFYKTLLEQSIKDFANSDFMKQTREYIKQRKAG